MRRVNAANAESGLAGLGLGSQEASSNPGEEGKKFPFSGLLTPIKPMTPGSN